MLRAAYFGQELLSTFNTSIGEIALLPATGGIFTVNLTYDAAAVTAASGNDANAEIREVLIWDRKADGGFPEAKILKQRIRNHIEPDKNLGHSDTPSSKKQASADVQSGTADESQVTDPTPESAAVSSDATVEQPAQTCTDCA